MFIHTSDYSCCLRWKQTVIHLPTPPENVTTLTWKLQNFFIWMKGCCVLSNVGALKRASCQLWYVATGMSGKQCHSKCSEWPPSALIHASSLFRHWSVAQYTMLYWNSAYFATSRCCKPQRVHIYPRAPPVASPTHSTRAMHVIGSTKNSKQTDKSAEQQLLFVFFSANVNNLKYMNNNVKKWLFWISQGKVLCFECRQVNSLKHSSICATLVKIMVHSGVHIGH